MTNLARADMLPRVCHSPSLNSPVSVDALIPGLFYHILDLRDCWLDRSKLFPVRGWEAKHHHLNVPVPAEVASFVGDLRNLYGMLGTEVSDLDIVRVFQEASQDWNYAVRTVGTVFFAYNVEYLVGHASFESMSAELTYLVSCQH